MSLFLSILSGGPGERPKGVENTGDRRSPEQANVPCAMYGKSKIFLCVHISGDVPRTIGSSLVVPRSEGTTAFP